MLSDCRDGCKCPQTLRAAPASSARSRSSPSKAFSLLHLNSLSRYLAGRGTALALLPAQPGTPPGSFSGGDMNRRIHQVCTIPALAVLALLVVTPFASAQEEDRGPAIEVFGAHVRTIESGGGSSQSYGLRGGYRFGQVWALEGSVSHLNEGFTNWFADLSAKAFFVRSNRFEIYGLAGPGLFRISAFGETRDQATVHAGLGAQIHLGERAYLRPEVRGHWATNDLVFKDGLVDYA